MSKSGTFAQLPEQPYVEGIQRFPFLKADECERVKGNLFDIALDMKEERKQRQSRGFHCKFYFEIMCFLDLYITMLLQWNRVTAL